MTGSATPKKKRPMPMPALNIIMNHEAVGYSGSSVGLPSLMPPRRET